MSSESLINKVLEGESPRRVLNVIEVSSAHVCINYRRDTEACRTGCKSNKPPVKVNGLCPYSDEWDDALASCPCYK